MKPLDFMNSAKNALLFCCALLSVVLLTKKTPAQTANAGAIGVTVTGVTIINSYTAADSKQNSGSLKIGTVAQDNPKFTQEQLKKIMGIDIRVVKDEDGHVFYRNNNDNQYYYKDEYQSITPPPAPFIIPPLDYYLTNPR